MDLIVRWWLAAVGRGLRRHCCVLLAALCGGAMLAAPVQAAEPPRDSAIVLPELAVSAQLRGPRIWRVSRDGHELWVLGSLIPLPRDIEWTTAEVERLLREADALLLPPEVRFDSGYTWLGQLLLLPSILDVQKNPEGQTLGEILPVELYTRWDALCRRYLPGDCAGERRRPILAARKLQDAALAHHGLTMDNLVAERVRRLARRHRVPTIATEVTAEVEDPKALLRDLSRAKLADTECLTRVLTRLEHEVEAMQLRAEAWRVGELDVLRQVPFTEAFRSCADAFLNNEIVARHGLADLETRTRDAWLRTAEAALGEHRSSVAVLPLSLVLAADGYLDELQRRGYRLSPELAADAALTAAP